MLGKDEEMRGFDWDELNVDLRKARVGEQLHGALYGVQLGCC